MYVLGPASAAATVNLKGPSHRGRRSRLPARRRRAGSSVEQLLGHCHGPQNHLVAQARQHPGPGVRSGYGPAPDPLSESEGLGQRSVLGCRPAAWTNGANPHHTAAVDPRPRRHPPLPTLLHRAIVRRRGYSRADSEGHVRDVADVALGAVTGLLAPLTSKFRFLFLVAESLLPVSPKARNLKAAVQPRRRFTSAKWGVHLFAYVAYKFHACISCIFLHICTYKCK